MKHHIIETHKHNFDIHNIVLSTQSISSKYLGNTDLATNHSTDCPELLSGSLGHGMVSRWPTRWRGVR